MLDFGDVNNLNMNSKLVLKNISKLPMVPRSIRVSIKDKYLSIGL